MQVPFLSIALSDLGLGGEPFTKTPTNSEIRPPFVISVSYTSCVQGRKTYLAFVMLKLRRTGIEPA